MSWFPDVQVPALRGGPRLRWGVLAPGAIAGDFTATVLTNTDQKITAVASRSPDRAAQFAARHGIDAVARSYEELVARSDVDIVYVAAPHSEHHPLAMLAISAGKHVLIEKPIAVSVRQAEEIADAARSAGVFAAEAMWTRYLPQFDVLAQILNRGDLGTVQLATADVGWKMGADAPPRFFDPDQGGGAALDMGVYGYWFAHFAIGRAQRIRAIVRRTSSGVDDQAAVALEGSEGRLASVTTSMAVTNSGLATILGTDGFARFVKPFVFPASFIVEVADGVHEWHDASGLSLRQGLAWQTSAIAQYVADGLTDSPVHGLSAAIDVLQVIDAVRAEADA